MKVVRGHWQMLVITAAILLLWFTPVIIPLKILIVFFHELSVSSHHVVHSIHL